jgi:hypothetical protein
MGLIYTRRVKQLRKKGDVGGLVLLLADRTGGGKERRGAAVALGDLRDPSAVGPLISVLDDYAVRGLAAEALGKIGDPRAIGPLMQLMHTSDNPIVTKSAQRGLDMLQ